MLRRALLTTLSLALLAAPTLGQALLELKPALGITFTNVSREPVGGSANGQVGYQLGGSALIGERLYLEGGLFLAKKSVEFTSTTTTSLNIQTGLTGLRIPVMVGYHLLGHPSEFLSLRVFGGGSLFMVTNVNAPGLTKADFTSPTYGLFAGVGLDLMMFFADLQYEWSLSDYSDLAALDVGQSRSLYLNAGVKIVF